MTRPSLAITFGMLLAVPGCSDYGTTGFATDTASGSIVVATAAGTAIARGNLSPTAALATPTVSPAAAAPRSTAAVGIYDIDTPVTKRHAGFLGSLVESRVRGSTLELRDDMTYVGRKDGEPESAGTWSIADGRVILDQTHESGEPTTNRGTGTLRDGVLSVETKRHGLTITLVFQRR